MKLRFLTGVAIVALGNGAPFAQQARRPAPPAPKAPLNTQRAAHDDVKIRQRDALRANGLRAAAAVTGEYTGVTRSHPEGGVRSLQQLATETPLIVIGVTRSHRSFLDDRERMIHTGYNVTIERVLKGKDARTGDEIMVSLKGGRVAFADGSYAHINTPDLLMPMNNERYVFFLEPSRWGVGPEQRKAARGVVYVPRLETIGLYLIDANERIRPRGPSGDVVRRAMSGKTLSHFVASIQRALR